MVKVLVDTCDICVFEESESPRPATGHLRISLIENDVTLQRSVAVCDTHSGDVIDPLYRLLKSIPAAADNVCPVCSRPFVTRHSLASHTRQIHGQRISDLEGRDRVGRPTACGVGDCLFMGATPAGAGLHRRVAHGIKGKRTSWVAPEDRA